MNIYFKIVRLIAFIYIMIGFICPTLISMRNDEAVILGWILVIVIIPIVCKMIINIVKEIEKKCTK